MIIGVVYVASVIGLIVWLELSIHRNSRKPKKHPPALGDYLE